MALSVFPLVLLAALAHALWNLLAKRSAGNFPVVWMGLSAANLALSPATVCLIARHGFPAAAVPYIAASAAAHAVYFFTLMRSYELAEISSAYPVARGLGVGGTALVALLVFHEQITNVGGAGILAICLGVAAVGAGDLGTRAGLKRLLWPALVGLSIVSYSVVDKKAVSLANPVVYINMMLSASLAALAPFVLRRHGRSLMSVWMANWRSSLLVGFGILGAYLLILFAFRTERASYIVAAREFSVVIAALLGALLLKEKLSPSKVGGILAITLGLVLIRLG